VSKRALVVAAVLFAALPLHAGFSEVVHAVEVHTQMHRVSIPFLGIARLASWIAHPYGVHDFQLATFEGNAREFDVNALTAIVKREAGEGFRPLVQSRSRRNGEFTMIFARPAGDGTIEFILATHDRGDTVVLRAVIDADKMLAHINEPKRFARLERE
jgi:hypothetical protein